MDNKAINLGKGGAARLAVYSEQPQGGMLPNAVYDLGELTAATTFELAAATDDATANIWYWTFETGATAPTITWPQAATLWADGEAPMIDANMHYEISVMNGVGAVLSAPIPTNENNG